MKLARLLSDSARLLGISTLVACAQGLAAAESAIGPVPDTLGWFRDARLGIFIHWGIYAEGKGNESWVYHDGKMPKDEYFAQARTFTAADYHPEQWAALFREAGARYVVLTSKHHDGFALWDTALSKLNAKDGSPAGRDLIGPYCEAVRHEGLKVGLYFSHLDWSHPDYASVMPPGAKLHRKPEHSNPLGYPQGEENPAAWERFLAFHRGQLRELSTRFHPDLLWFDGDWERSAEQWRFPELRTMLKELNPEVILNSRMGGYGDYETPEQFIPLVQPKGPWELCLTINDSWGYQKADTNHKTVRQVVRMLAECAGMGGNLLLDVGPKSDGSLQPEQVALLKGLGRWTSKHAEALYGTTAGLPPGYFFGVTTLNKARDVLYLYYFEKPMGPIALKGVRNRIRRMSVLGGPELSWTLNGGAHWLNMPGVLWINLPDTCLDPEATVIKVELEGPLDLAVAPVVEKP